jgi:hypothetical protein
MSATTITFADATLTSQTGVSVLSAGTGNVILGGAGQNLSITITDTPVVSVQDTATPANVAYGAISLTSADGTMAITNPSAGVLNFEANGVAPGGGKPLASYNSNVVASLGVLATPSPYSLTTPALALWQPYPYSVPSTSGIGNLYMDLTIEWVVPTANPPASVSVSVFQSGTATPTTPYLLWPGISSSSTPTSQNYINSMGAWTMPIINGDNSTGELANPVGGETTTRTFTQTISASLRTLAFPSSGYPNIFVMILPTYLATATAGTAPTCSVVYNRFYSP